MAEIARESRTSEGLLIPKSFEAKIRCDMCNASVTRHVSGLSDAMRAIRHMKGWLVADEGWQSKITEKTGESFMICPAHRKEI